MEAKETTETERLARHVDEHDLYSSEEAAEVLLDALERRGGSLVAFESTYWGNETFGDDQWTDLFYADVVHETDDGIKFAKAVDASYILAAYAKKRNAENELENPEESAYETLGEDYWESQIAEAERHLAEFDPRASDMLGGGWAPKSKVVFQAERDGPAEFVQFRDGDNDGVVGHQDDAETAITGITTVHSGRRRYRKLEIQVPYKEDHNPKTHFDWEMHHFAAKYENDNFVCWTADKNPREIASILSEHYDGCAVHEDVLDNYDG